MEFNVLPKAKILSPHTRNKSNQTNTQTVNVIFPNNQPKQDSRLISMKYMKDLNELRNLKSN